MDFLTLTEAQIALWHDITPANETARRMVADTQASIAAFQAVRHRMRFEDEPASFERALQDCAE